MLHFALSVASIVVGLPAVFDAQGGLPASPVRALLGASIGVLLAPLGWLQPWLPQRAGFAYGEIAAVSVLFGAAAVVLGWGVRRLLRARGSRAA